MKKYFKPLIEVEEIFGDDPIMESTGGYELPEHELGESQEGYILPEINPTSEP